MSAPAPQTFIDPQSELEYIRVPAADLPDGDFLESTEQNTWDVLEPPSGYVRSQNGWTCGRNFVASYTIPGTTTRMALRRGDVSIVLLDYFSWYDAHIENIDGSPLDDWGFAERPIRGYSDVYSNHFSGTAGDLNATKHPLGVRGTLSAVQKERIRAKLKEYGGVIRPGFDYSGRVDEMHNEINRSPLFVAKIADKIRVRGMVAPVKPRLLPAPYGYTADGDRVLGLNIAQMHGPDVRNVRNALRYIGNRGLKASDVYDNDVAATINLLKSRHPELQGEKGCGQKCWRYLRAHVPH